MNQTQLQSLKNEILQDPKNLGYSTLLPNQPGRVVELLNNTQLGDTTIGTKWIDIGHVLHELGPENGAQVLNTLDALRANSPVIKWAWYLLEQGKLDVGLSSTRQQLDQLAQAGAMSMENVLKIKKLAEVPASRAQVLVGQQVTEEDLRNALEQ